MRPSNPTLDSILEGPFQSRALFDVFYDDAPTYPNLPVSEWDVTGDLESELKSTANLTVDYNGVDGTGLSPTRFLDTLAPYGQQINMVIECSLRGRRETVQIGRFRINKVPEMSDSWLKFADRTLIAGSKVKLQVDDLLSMVKRDGIRYPSPPIRTASTWEELGRLTGFPITRSIDDRPTPAGLLYQPREGGRLLAVQQLASHLGGIAATNSFGELTVVPFDGTDAPPIELGSGQIIAPPRSLDTEGLYNGVVGSYQEEDGTPIYAEKWITSGPLASDGPYGPYPYFDSSDTVQTQADADQRVADVLTRLVGAQTFRIPLTCKLNPLIEFGDLVTVTPANGDALTGRVVSWNITKGATTMALTLDVARDVPAA